MFCSFRISQKESIVDGDANNLQWTKSLSSDTQTIMQAKCH